MSREVSFRSDEVAAPPEDRLHAAPPRNAFGTYLQMRAVLRDLEVALESFLSRHGLTIADYCALRLIHEEGARSLSGLGRWVSIGNSATTKLVDRLERRGLVERVRDQQDRRVWNIVITDVGTALTKQIIPAHQANVAMLLSCLDEQQIGGLHDLLTGLRACLDERLASGRPLDP